MIDLEELVPSLRRMVNPPGSELFPDATDLILVGYLSDAFWLGKLDGFYTNYTEADGLVEPIDPTDDDLARDWQQLIVFYAGMQIVENELRAKNTSFRAQAGPVEYEVQNSAQLLRDHLSALHRRRDYLLELLSEKYNISPGYVDMICARTNAISMGYSGYEGGVAF